MRGRTRIAAITCLALASAAGSGGAGTDPTRARPDDRCGHVAELLAARRAAELGNEEKVLEHLRKADAILARCLRDAAPDPAPGGGAPREVGTG